MLDIIKSKLKELNPYFLEVKDESHLHQKGVNTHFKVTIVSAKFAGLNKVKRHQLIYSVLQDVMPCIHALSISVFTQEEWEKGVPISSSPTCLGGGLLG